MAVPHRTPPQDRNRRPRVEGLNLEITDVIRRIGDALDAGLVDAIFDHAAFDRRAHEDRLAHDLVAPARDTSARVETRADAMQDEGPIEAALDVILAGPDELDGDALAECFRDVRNFFSPIRNGVAAPTETSAAKCCVDPYLLRPQSQNSRNGGLIDALQLTARP